MRERTVLLVALWAACLGCGQEAELRDRAGFLCKYGQLVAPKLDALPKEKAAGDYIHPDDLAYLEEQERERSGGAFAQLGNALAAGLRPATRAVAEAAARRTECEVSEVSVEGDRATVTVQRTVPQLEGPDLLKKMGELSGMESHEARVEAAEAWYEGAAEKKIESRQLTFARQGDRWLVVYELRASAEAEAARAKQEEERRAELAALRDEARELYRRERLPEARAKLEAARALDPEDATIEEELKAVQEAMAALVAGRWSKSEEKDRMTDHRNIYVRLPAEAPIGSGFTESTPVIMARCQEGSFSLYVSVGTMVDTSWRDRDRASVRYRFGEEPAERMKMSVSTDRKAVFFRDEEQWSQKLVEHDGAALALEVPLVLEGTAVITFDLTGAQKALELVQSACKD